MLTIEIQGYPQKKLFFCYQTVEEAFEEAYPNVLTALKFKMELPLPLVNYKAAVWEHELNASKNDAYLLLPLTFVEIAVSRRHPERLTFFNVPSEYRTRDLLLWLEYNYGITKVAKVKSNIVSGRSLKPEERIHEGCWVQCTL